MNKEFWFKPASLLKLQPQPTLYYLARKIDLTLFVDIKPINLLEKFDFDISKNRILTPYSPFEDECFKELVDSLSTSFNDYPRTIGIGECTLLNHAQLLIAIWNTNREFNTTKILDELIRIFSIISIPTENIIKISYTAKLGPKFQDEAKN